MSMTAAQWAEFQARNKDRLANLRKPPQPEPEPELDRAREQLGLSQPTIEQAQELANRKAYREVFDEASPGEQFMAGVGKSAIELGYGIQDLFGELDESQRQTLQMLDAQHGVYATAGEITGDVGMTLLPAGGVARGAQAVTKGAPTLARAGAIIAGESGLAGLYEGVKTVGSAEERAEAGTEAAAMAAILGIPFAGAGSFAPGLSEQAKELVKKGVRITPGMSGGPARASIESVMSKIPVIGGATENLQNIAIEDWNQMLLQRVSPTDDIVEAGHKGFTDVQKRFKREYTDIWNKVRPTSYKYDNFESAIVRADKKLQAVSEADLRPAQAMTNRVQNDVLKFATQPMAKPRLIDKLDRDLRDRAADAMGKGNVELAEYYGSLRKAVRSGVDEKTIKRLDKTDLLYRDFKTLEHGGAYKNATIRGAKLVPNDLTSAVTRRSTPAQRTKGKASLQPEMDQANMTMGPVLSGRSPLDPEAPLVKAATAGALALEPAVSASTLTGGRLLVNEGMRKFLTGQPLGDFKNLPAVARIVRMAGVSKLNDIKDPVLRNLVEKEIEAEMTEAP